MANDNCSKSKQNQIIFCICTRVVEDSRPIDFSEDRLRGCLLYTSLNKFSFTCGTIRRLLKNKTQKETQLKFYKVVAVPTLMCGYETWTLLQKDISKAIKKYNLVRKVLFIININSKNYIQKYTSI